MAGRMAVIRSRLPLYGYEVRVRPEHGSTPHQRNGTARLFCFGRLSACHRLTNDTILASCRRHLNCHRCHGYASPVESRSFSTGAVVANNITAHYQRSAIHTVQHPYIGAELASHHEPGSCGEAANPSPRNIGCQSISGLRRLQSSKGSKSVSDHS